MLLLLFITLAKMYQAYLGIEYFNVQRYKPKWSEWLFADKKANAIKIEEMEYNFQDWNRNMRIKLEVYFRSTMVVTLAYMIQITLILAFFH